FEHAEERQAARRRDFRRHTGTRQAVGRIRRRSFPGWICLSVREAHYPTLSRQSVATVHVAEAGESRFRVGDLSDAQENECKSFSKSWSRSQGLLRSEGPRAWGQSGSLYQ